MSDKYVLRGTRAVKCDDLNEWATWFETSSRRVAESHVGAIRISTVFLGLDHSFGVGPPILFETMIFGGRRDEYQERCSTWEQAQVQHQNAVNLVAMDAGDRDGKRQD